jgi:hypothetical protein
MDIESKPDLPQVVSRRTASGSLSGGIDARNQEPEQNGDDHHHHEKLDQGKGLTGTLGRDHGLSCSPKNGYETTLVRLSLNSDVEL